MKYRNLEDIKVAPKQQQKSGTWCFSSLTKSANYSNLGIRTLIAYNQKNIVYTQNDSYP